MRERGADELEVIATIDEGEKIPAKHGRIGFRRNFWKVVDWQRTTYLGKQLEVYCAESGKDLVVVTVIVKYLS